jgi:hypothetical protein
VNGLTVLAVTEPYCGEVKDYKDIAALLLSGVSLAKGLVYF